MNAARPLTRREELAALFFFLLAPVLFTYPLFFLGPGQVYGLQEDVVRYLHLFWSFQKNEDWLFLDRHYPQLNAPFGWDVQTTAQRLFWLPGAIFSKWVNPWNYTNWVIALSFPLSGWFFFRLAFQLTGSFSGSLLGGFLFMFSPCHFSKAEDYPEMASIEWVPIYGLAFLRFLRTPTIRNAVMAGIVFVLVFNFSYILGSMMAVMIAFLLTGWLIQQRLEKGHWMSLPGGPASIFCFAHLLAFSGVFWDSFTVTNRETMNWTNSFHRPVTLSNLIVGTVSPWHFFLPTYYHPLWGDLVRRIMDRLKPGTWFFDDVVNPGFVCWGLVFIAVWRLFSERKWKDKEFQWAVLAMSLFSVWLCLRPFWGKTLLPFPNVLIYSLFPSFRYFERFGVFVSFGFSLLAVWGFQELTSRWKGRARRILLVGLMGLAAFELYCPTSARLLDVSKVPPEYGWLQKQPGDFIVAEYPLVTRNFHYELRYCMGQMYHGKRLFNLEYQELGVKKETIEFRKTLADFTNPRTVRLLRGFGVRYIVAHKVYYLVDEDPGRDPAPLLPKFQFPAKIPGLRLVENWNTFSIYEVLPR